MSEVDLDNLNEKVKTKSEENLEIAKPLKPSKNKAPLFSILALFVSIVGLTHISLLLLQLHYNGQSMTTSYFYAIIVGSLLMISFKRKETFNKLSIITIWCAGLCVAAPIIVGLIKILSAVFYIVADLITNI